MKNIKNQRKARCKMKLNIESIQNKSAWEGYSLPNFDIEKVRQNTLERPQWVHFGAGNIFRIFPAVLCQRLIQQGDMDTGIVCCESYDDEIVTKCFRPYDNLSLAVTLNADGSIEKEVVASMVESLTLLHDSDRILEIFKNPSLQMVSFTITEKGYSLRNPAGEIYPPVVADMENSPKEAKTFMAVLANMCIERFHACNKPLTLVSMDNCSHNGEKLRQAIIEIAEAWNKNGKITKEEFAFITDEVAFPWSMIDKITPRPDPSVEAVLKEDGLEEISPFITTKNTYTAAFVNAERPQYLVIEDTFKNSRPPLEKAGVYMTDRETVNKTETMKVTGCLNPLHTAMSVYGCLLGHTLISAEMKDEDIVKLINTLGYKEALPVVTDPKILSPKSFIDEVLTQRLPNPFMPDAPQRIATDTSQKVGIRFGETIKNYVEKGTGVDTLVAIPLAIAGWLRYLLGVDDNGEVMEVSADPLKDELQGKLSGITFGDKATYNGQLKDILSNKSIFGVDLVEVGLSDKIEEMFVMQLEGKGSVRATLKKYLA